MTYAQRLRKLADSTGLDAFGDEIRAIADEMDAQPADVTDAEIEALFGKCGGHWSGDQWVIEDADLHPFARTILALRPERAPMTEDQVWHNDALMSANGTAGFKMDALMRIVRAAEAHHFGITTQPKGGE